MNKFKKIMLMLFKNYSHKIIMILHHQYLARNKKLLKQKLLMKMNQNLIKKTILMNFGIKDLWSFFVVIKS